MCAKSTRSSPPPTRRATPSRGCCGFEARPFLPKDQRTSRLRPRMAPLTGARAPGCRSGRGRLGASQRSEEHTSELQSHSDLVCRLLLEKKKKKKRNKRIEW